MSNISLAQNILEWLSAQGVSEICLCPGGRNAPFVFHLEKSDLFQLHTSFDERSAAFFAMGLAQKQQRPVALIVTSGTAVAEALPAVIESYYTRTPLVIISADRPRKLRGTGAPQTIEQVNLFTNYVENCVDCEGEFSSPTWTQSYSLHLNVCFSEPLIDDEILGLQAQKLQGVRKKELTAWSDILSTWQKFSGQVKKPLLIVSGLKKYEQEVVGQWLKSWKSWVYLEGTSGLRETGHEFQIHSGDRFFKTLLQENAIDGVLRIGSVPTNRFWRDLDNLTFPVLSFSSLPFSGMQRGEHCFFPLAQLSDLPVFSHEAPSTQLIQKDRSQRALWEKLLLKYPQSEPALFRWLSQQVPPEASLYVGNSLPIREWDLFAQPFKNYPVLANRGANGIDGQLSTALAYLDKQKELWVILGDLTALYDANAPWFWQKNPQKLKLVVINNQGGKIFERLFKNSLFYNSHNIHFKNWAEQWGLQYQKLEKPTQMISESAVIEVCPDLAQTAKFWQEYDRIWSKS